MRHDCPASQLELAVSDGRAESGWSSIEQA